MIDIVLPPASDCVSVEEALAAEELFGHGDHGPALELWAEIRERYPANPNGYPAGRARLRSRLPGSAQRLVDHATKAKLAARSNFTTQLPRRATR
jgi:hypothetical protein